MGLDLARVRADTPALADLTFLNNAGAALPPTPVLDTVVAHLRREAEIGGYEAEVEAQPRIDEVYAAVGRLVGTPADRIALVDSATTAWNAVVYGYPFRPGDRVLVGNATYSSSAIALLHLRERVGLEIVRVEDDATGQISLDGLERELRAGAAMVALTHVPTSSGLVNPAAAVGALCREYGAFYVLDACQSVGQLPVDLEEIGCDALAATGRKFLRAPRGTGFLALSERALDVVRPSTLDNHSATWTSEAGYEVRNDARRFETWERNIAAVLGLGAAVDYLLALGVTHTWPRIHALGSRLRAELSELAEIHDAGQELCGIVTFTVPGVEARAVRRALRAEHIHTWVSSAEGAHYDLGRRGLPDVVRASVHYTTDDDEVDALRLGVLRVMESERFGAPA